MNPTRITPNVQLFQGEALAVLQSLPSDFADALITDPPYSSGGFTRSDRAADPATKYVQQGTKLQRPSFSGDNRDQRSYLAWCGLWLHEALRVVRPGGYALVFTDWRQLPITTDALQVGGWVWRGLIAWDKGRGARAPHKGYFRHQCEYIVWATKGPANTSAGGPWDGCYQVPVYQSDKHHLTGKPTDLMRRLVQVVPAGGTVLDPFMGSGTTGVAAVAEGRRFVGVELDPGYFNLADRRIQGEAGREAQGLFDTAG